MTRKASDPLTLIMMALALAGILAGVYIGATQSFWGFVLAVGCAIFILFLGDVL